MTMVRQTIALHKLVDIVRASYIITFDSPKPRISKRRTDAHEFCSPTGNRTTYAASITPNQLLKSCCMQLIKILSFLEEGQPKQSVAVAKQPKRKGVRLHFPCYCTELIFRSPICTEILLKPGQF